MDGVIEKIRKEKPLVHCLTNYVTVNDCANLLIAAGASPIMADAKEEMSDMVQLASSLCINIGTLNARTFESMLIAGKEANRLDKPIIFDPVGVGASTFRQTCAQKLLSDVKCTVIRGNISEIKLLAKERSESYGVDANIDDLKTNGNMKECIKTAQKVANKFGTVVVITGEIDVVTDGSEVYLVKNGHPLMSKMTGSGCQLSALIGAFIANEENILKASLMAVCTMGICGEIAAMKLKKNEGNAMYRNYLIDALFLLTDETITHMQKIENVRK